MATPCIHAHRSSEQSLLFTFSYLGATFFSTYAQDKTFTCTLFAPTSEFERLSSREAISRWFSRHFPDALSLIGEERLIEDFERNPRGALVSIKVR
jgi:hypothetical protein